MTVWSTVFLENSVTAHIVEITRIIWNPNFFNFVVFFGDVAGNHLLLQHDAASLENRTPKFS